LSSSLEVGQALQVNVSCVLFVILAVTHLRVLLCACTAVAALSFLQGLRQHETTPSTISSSSCVANVRAGCVLLLHGASSGPAQQQLLARGQGVHLLLLGGLQHHRRGLLHLQL
jgi:uncharacterized membrane protein YbjE (DUF340 family)